MSERISIAKLRKQVGTHPHSWPRTELLALLDAIERVDRELRALEKWAGEQNAGNAWATQVRWWASSHRERLLASFDFGEAE